MSTEDNKAVVRRFFQAFADNDRATLEEVLAPDLAAYLPGSRDPLTRDVHIEIIDRWNTAFNDLRIAIEDEVAEGDRVATRITLRGDHDRGEFQGIAPTGRRIEISAITMERMRDGVIAERRVVLDFFDLMQQLGKNASQRMSE